MPSSQTAALTIFPYSWEALFEQAAREFDNPLLVPRVAWQRSQSLLAVGAYGAGLTLMRRTRREMGHDPTHMDARTRSVYGSLHLRSAILAARAASTEGEARRREASYRRSCVGSASTL
ncbi:MAG TPA: hypothetical protein VFU65_18525 [Actinocrinis sp.]|nr:hypothetical protein [Actinocrinis sp.]